MRGIDKSFGSNQVLKQAGFTLESGEVHALMGENGAGKSTLMKILTGVYTKDAGTVLVDGKEVNYKNPQEAEKAGIVFIYQELNVMFDLTVEENLFMGKEIHGKFGICDKKAMQKKAQEALNILGVNISPKTVMAELSVGQQQMVEICKALMADAIATSAGAILGTSTTTTFVESSAGVGAGARTGLASIVTGLLFLLAIFFAPIFTAIPGFATAPALIFVGFLMVSAIVKVDFEDLTDAVPAYLCLIAMPLMYSIAEGIAIGVISFVLINLICGKRKKITPLMYILAVLFICKYIFL